MNKFIRTSTWLSIALFLAAAAGFVTFKLIKPTVDAQGILHEPFFLLPLSFLAILLGLLIGLISLAARLVRARRKSKASQ